MNGDRHRFLDADDHVRVRHARDPAVAADVGGTRSSAITDTAPAASAIFASSGVTTSMMTPPLSISASPVLTRRVAVSFTGVMLAAQAAQPPSINGRLCAAYFRRKALMRSA